MWEKIAPSRVAESKPQASLLHAEVPWNYILGRLAAALQNVFASATPLPQFFPDVYIFQTKIPRGRKDCIEQPFLYACYITIKPEN